jgi:hypothetical protein
MRSSDAIFEDINYVQSIRPVFPEHYLLLSFPSLDSLNQVGIQREQPPCIHSFFSLLYTNI